MTVTPTQLRADLYRLLDQVVATGQPLLVSRGGTTLRIARVEAAHMSEDPLPVPALCRDLVVGDPADLVTPDWSQFWQAGRDL